MGRHGKDALVGLNPLVGERLEELGDRQAAGVARRPGGGQGVVGADRLVGEGDRGAAAQEDRAVVAQPFQVPVVVSGVDLEVFGGDLVREGGSVLAAFSP